MKQVSVSVGLLMLAVSTQSVAQDLVELKRGTEPIEAFGFAVQAPQRARWFGNPSTDGHYVVFFRWVGKVRRWHTEVVGVRTSWVTDCEDHEGCLEKAAESARAGVEGIEVTTLELSKEDVDEPTCRWMDKIEDDRRSGGPPLEVRVSGLLCTHPDDPNLVLQVAVSERFKKGKTPTADFASNAKSFADTFEFRPLEVALASVVEVGEGSGYIEPANGSLWIHGRQSVYQLDLESRQVKHRFKSPSPGNYPIAYDSESIWFAARYQPQLLARRPSDGAVQTTIDLPITPYTTKKGFGSLWVTPDHETSVIRVDPTTGKVIAEIEVGKDPREIAIGDESVWVSENRRKGLVWQIDPATNNAVTSLQPCANPLGIERGSGYLWVVCGKKRKIVRIDPATREVSGSVEVGGNPILVDSDARTVWVTHRGLGTVTAVDIETMKVITHIPLGRAMLYVKVVDGSTWVTDEGGGNVYEIRRRNEQ